MRKYKKFITSDPAILGGTPVIRGTRVPVSRILFLLKDGYTIEAINEEYPHLGVKTIAGAIDEAVEIINSKQNVSSLL